MRRKPLSQIYPNTGLVLGPGTLGRRPKAAALIGECIATWSEVELQMARLLSTMLHANTEPAVALYLSLPNSNIRQKALDSVADFALSSPERNLYDAIIRVKNRLEAQRNDMAHGLFGVATEEEEGVAWITSKERIRHMLRLEISMERGDDLSSINFRLDPSKIFIYTLPELDHLLQEMRDFHQIVYGFVSLTMRPEGSDRNELREQLCALHLIRNQLTP